MFDRRRYMCHIQFFLGGGFNMFLFTLLFGEMIHFDNCNIFQMGWFNHQLVPNCVGIILNHEIRIPVQLIKQPVFDGK